jgi:hypothetical protein
MGSGLRRKHNAVLWMGSGTTPIVYLFRDDFGIDESAPLASPRNTLVITDTANRLSVNAGALDATVDATTAGFRTAAIPRASGIMLFLKMKTLGSNNHCFGLYSTTAQQTGYTSLIDGGYLPLGSAIRDGDGILSTSMFPTGELCIVVMATGTHYLMRTSNIWYRLWVSDVGNINPFYVHYSPGASNAYSLDSVAGVQASAPWLSNADLYTSNTATVTAGTIFTSPADQLIKLKWTPVASDIFEVSIRRTDDNNRWVIRGDQSAGTIKIIKIESGIETEVASGTTSFTAGAVVKISIFSLGQTISAIVNSSRRANYNAAIFNLSATGAKVSHAVSDLTLWPITLTGTAHAEVVRLCPF